MRPGATGKDDIEQANRSVTELSNILMEFWRRGDRETLHSIKWLKLLSGKPTDVLKWIRTNSDATL